ncbi:hypothetical protein AA0535_2733 [Asaia krungthepensis NRIC 0535]|uniref:Uncharacterized protein n=2 Tax=Asaia krungthepensis TaxID=220990 RepID=A0ABQ0Q638_9PROT|nr:hypothetical protein AA0535_2733 [Asaia krungthepensis NRIC 0535]
MDRAQALTAILRRETGVRRARRNAEADIVTAERSVLASDDEDCAVEGFVNWLPEARAAIERARVAEREVAIDVAVAYQAFIQARAAARRKGNSDPSPVSSENGPRPSVVP